MRDFLLEMGVEGDGEEMPEDMGSDWDNSFNYFVPRVDLKESVAIAPGVVELVQQLPVDLVATIGDNNVRRLNEVPRREYVLNDNVLVDEVGNVVEGDDVLLWADRNNRTLFRKIVSENKEDMMDAAFCDDPEKSLKIYRTIRKADRLGDRLSKKIDSAAKGGTTFGKIMPLLLRIPKKDRKKIVVFGCANRGHKMSYLPGVRLCVDIAGIGDEFFVKGDLREWRKYVRDGDVIVSDCSIGGSDGDGMYVPLDYLDIYEQMAKNHYVIAKLDKLRDRAKYAATEVYRRHNREYFALFGRALKRKVRLYDPEAMMLEGNDDRMGSIISKKYMLNTRSAVREEDIDSIMENAFYEKRGVKGNSVLEDLCAGAKRKVRGWKEMCMDKDAYLPGYGKDLSLDFELPAIMMDIGNIYCDPERLWAYLHTYFKTEFDESVGWVCVE